jgi:hypothetical protein
VFSLSKDHENEAGMVKEIKRLPEFDFEPADDGIIVKAFHLSF